MNKKIYLMRPFVGEEELEAVRKVLEAEGRNQIEGFQFFNQTAEYLQKRRRTEVIL